MTLAKAIAFFLEHWKWFALAAVVLLLSVQSGRLAHAKADQFDRSACIVNQPCKAVKWKDEVATLRPALVSVKADLETCHGNESRLGVDLKRQNDATDAARAEGDRKDALIARGRQEARKSALAAQSASERLLSFQAKGADACARLLSVDDQVKEIAP